MILSLELQCVDNATPPPPRRNLLRINIFQMIDHCKERIYKETTTVLSEILTFHGNITCNKYHKRNKYRKF